MKLKAITEPREGFVYEYKEEGKTKYLIYGDSVNLDNGQNYIYSSRHSKFLLKKMKLVGKIGITHEIKDGRLVETPRGEIELDDVFSDELADEDGNVIVITYYECDDKFTCSEEWGDFSLCNKKDLLGKYKHIGILGVHYEFVNSKE